MSWLRNGTSANSGGSLTTATVTVPTGTTSGNSGVFEVSANNSVAGTGTFSSSRSGVTFTTLVTAQQVTNTSIFVVTATGLVAGDTVTFTPSVGATYRLTHQYFSGAILTPVGTLGKRSTTTAATVAPTYTITGGQTVYAYCITRQTTAGVSLSSVVNSNGRTITQRWVEYQGSATPNTNTSLVEFTEPTTATGTTTFTDSQTSANGAAFHFVEAPASPGAGTASGATAWTGTATGTAPVVPTLTSLVCGGVGTTTAKVRLDGTPGTSCTVTAATNTGLTAGAVTSSSVTLDSDGLGIATLTGLSAGTDYYVGATLAGTPNATRARMRTSTSGAYSFSFATASCSATGVDPIVLDSIRTRTGAAGGTADFFVHLGDIHYRERNTTNATTILNDWRAVTAGSHFAALAAAMQVEYTWSDHDLGPDNSTGASLGAGVMAAEQATFARYWPTYDLPAVDTDNMPYRSWVRGRVRFVMTEGRAYSSDIAATDNSSKTKLGATQKQWLKDEWTAAKAAGQAIVWLHEDGGWTATSAYSGDDTWAAYSTERTELASFITANSLSNRIVLIHGDFHGLGADDGTNSPGGIPVVCASPLAQTYFMPSQERWSVGKYPTTDPGVQLHQYGWFDVVDTGASTLSLVFTGYSNDNTGGTSADTSRMTMTRSLATTDVKAGTATGSTTYTGTATGARTSAGSAAGATSRTSTATGTRSSSGSTTGATTHLGSAPGSRASSGTAAGATAHIGTATGSTSHRGTTAGTTTWSGAASGSTPAVGGNSGTATGARTYTGAANGKAAYSATAAGVTSRTGVATGRSVRNGAGVGTTIHTGTASGQAPAVGTKTGSAAGATARSGTATGKASHYGATAGATVWVGAAVGRSDVDYRDLTLTAHLAPERLASALAPTRLAATLEAT